MNATFEKIDSYSELCERLRRRQQGVILGHDDESHKEYFLASLSGCLIGVCSQGQGIQPSILQDAVHGTVWIGYNSSLANVDTSRCRKTLVIRLDSVFFCILCHMQDGSVIVIHELGATRVDAFGRVLWSVSTSVVTAFAEGSDEIDLTTEDGTVRVNKESGSRL